MASLIKWTTMGLLVASIAGGATKVKGWVACFSGNGR